MVNANTAAEFSGAYQDKRVLVTGHTGFKGSWLCEWLIGLGANVTGLALPPRADSVLFETLNLGRRVQHIEGDIRDPLLVREVVQQTKPDFLFHLAAQPLVRRAYAEPIETFATNVMGTAHVLEALRHAARPAVAVIVTTDKCYENREWVHAYREEDRLGGHDPYSASKAAAEIVASAYRHSYFEQNGQQRSPVLVATARAGNVIGGGDWAEDRIVPDCVRGLQRGEPILVRNRVATRPWQHVLEPLSGYLWLGACLARLQYPGASAKTDNRGDALLSAFNFGPELASNRTVEELVREVLKHWPGEWVDKSSPNAPHEAQRLNLSIDKAKHILGWSPVWDFETAVAATIAWYKADSSQSMRRITHAQIDAYVSDALRAGIPWARPSLCTEVPAADPVFQPVSAAPAHLHV